MVGSRGKGKPEAPAPILDVDVKVNVRFPFALYSNARKMAADRGQSFNAWLSGLISDALKRV